jgi:protein gp37
MQQSKIEWTDTTWNPVTGCTKVSQGCKNCYAERLYERFHGKGSFRNVICHYNRLSQPFKFKGNQRVFVNSMSDLFHKDVSDQFIVEVLHVISKTPQHTYQVLTKRPERMLEFFTNCAINPYDDKLYPIPQNLWLGVSVEDQQAADERIPLLLQVPAAVRFLSCEPLLGPVDIIKAAKLTPNHWGDPHCPPSIQWIIAGGESGPKARPTHPDWVRLIRDQCEDQEVTFFFKQWGEYIPFENTAQPPFMYCSAKGEEYDSHHLNVIDPETSEAGRFMGKRWMEVLDAVHYCHELKSADCMFLKVGKKAAGRLLDGKEYNGMPSIAITEEYDNHD